jgi:rhodanese-related sulfurtransferase
LGQQRRYESIAGEDLYRMLAMGRPVVLLDVRTESEYATRHVPGSLLIPLHQLESRLSELPINGTPIAVLCEHGIRSHSACRLLAEHGVKTLYDVAGGLDAWPGPVASRLAEGANHDHPIAPSRFLVDNFDLLTKGLALDLAMGEGRNAIYLASRGYDVDGVDVDAGAVARARASARRLGAPIRAVVGNVEDGTYIVPIETYDLIVVFHFLHRPLFHDIRDGLKPGGCVVYQTFTTEQAQFGRPKDPAHLLQPGELQGVFADWEILRFREAIEPGIAGAPPKALAGIVARKPST